MPRNIRLIIPNICHHAVQGGNNRQDVFQEKEDRFYNRKYRRSGKLWENRYKLHPFDPEVYYVVLRYIERNPVRAGMVADGAEYPWSSGAYHLLGRENKIIMADCLHDSAFSYGEFFYEQERSEDMEAIREAAQQGKAWGRAAFLERLGNKLNRVVVPRKRGRPKRTDK